MSDYELAELCRKIYAKHKQALDLIFEHRPDLQLEMADKIYELVSQYSTTKNLLIERENKTYILFSPKEWKDKKLPLGFNFKNTDTDLETKLLICPVGDKFYPAEDQSIRERLHQISKNHPEIFERSKWKEGWITIYQKQIMNQKDYENANVEDLINKFQLFWQNFIDDDFVKITDIIHKNMDYIINPPSTPSSEVTEY